MTMQLGGQSIVDRLLAAKNTIAGQAVAKVVCKATTEEILGPKRKHLDFLIQATHEMNVSIPEIADLLIERSQNSSWVVAFKSLITIHHLMSYGSERFEAYMASHNHHLQSSIYVDRMGMPGGDMSSYIRRYVIYLNEKRESYKLLGYDFCKITRGKDNGFLRTLPTDALLKTLPILQKQLDALLHFEVAPNELINGVINSCFFLLIKDLIYLYSAFNDGIINLLEKYFDMNKKQCREALDIYKKFLDRTDQVSQYMKIAERYEQLFDRTFWQETSGIERNEMPDLSQTVAKNKASNSLLEALENHLLYVDTKKPSSQSLTSKQIPGPDLKIYSRDFVVNNNEEPKKFFEDETKTFAQFNKKQEPSPSPSPTPLINTNGNGFGETDFFAEKSLPNNQQQLLTDDLFSFPTTSSQTVTNTFPLSSSSQTVTNAFPTSSSQTITNTFPAFQNASDTLAPKQNIFDDILQPTSIPTNRNPNIIPLHTSNQNIPFVSKPLQTGDLNSSLNHLIENLDIKDYSKIGKDHQWTPSDGKNQQIIGMSAGTMNTPGTTWPNSSAINVPFNNINVQSGAVWPQQPSSVPSTNNPFAVPSGSLQTGFNGMNNQTMHTSTNPFAPQPFYNASSFNQKQVSDPFGNL